MKKYYENLSRFPAFQERVSNNFSIKEGKVVDSKRNLFSY
jgi:hypothetical protein